MGPASNSDEGRMAGRGATAALVAALIMMAAERASAGDEPIAATAQPETTIVLHVVNYAALSRTVLDQAIARVAMIYEGIGVRTVWADSEQPVRKHQDGGLHLTVMLLSRDMAQKKISAESIKDDVLGQAVRPYGRAYIFCDRIATASPAFFGIRLGAVIAHEVGHLVLPTKSHSLHGMMSANVDVRDIQLQSFDKTQARAIHAALMEQSGGQR
jgi:hypothetical protein